MEPQSTPRPIAGRRPASATPRTSTPPTRLATAADAQAAVDTAYDLAAKLLAGQHAVVGTVIAATKQATSDSPRALAASPRAMRVSSSVGAVMVWSCERGRQAGAAE